MIETLANQGKELSNLNTEKGNTFNPDTQADISSNNSDVHAPLQGENHRIEMEVKFDPDELAEESKNNYHPDLQGTKTDGSIIIQKLPGEETRIPHLPKPMLEISSDNKTMVDTNYNPDTQAEVSKRTERTPVEGSGGHWDGERGNSNWIPDDDEIPSNPKTNPEGKNWREIKDDYKVEKIPFAENKPDFSEISKGTVEIEDFSDDRDANFYQADEALAEQKECEPEDVYRWRKEHRYTWHEGSDCKTMQKVPTEVHGNVPHSGGIAEYKSRQQGV